MKMTPEQINKTCEKFGFQVFLAGLRKGAQNLRVGPVRDLFPDENAPGGRRYSPHPAWVANGGEVSIKAWFDYMEEQGHDVSLLRLTYQRVVWCYPKPGARRRRRFINKQPPPEAEVIGENFSFCIPLFQGPECEDMNLLIRIHAALRFHPHHRNILEYLIKEYPSPVNVDALPVWHEGLLHPVFATSKKFTPGERVSQTNGRGAKKRKRVYYFVCSYRSGGIGNYRLMRDDGVLCSSSNVGKYVPEEETDGKREDAGNG